MFGLVATLLVAKAAARFTARTAPMSAAGRAAAAPEADALTRLCRRL